MVVSWLEYGSGPYGVGEMFGLGPDELGLLFPEEASILSPAAVEERRREFIAGRLCAHSALLNLGLSAEPILAGLNHEPQWPRGVVGSITHCAGYVAAIAAPVTSVQSLGIDAEPHLPLSQTVVEAIARPDEIRHHRELQERWPTVSFSRILFCVKEAAYKYWNLRFGWALNISDIQVRMDPITGRSWSYIFSDRKLGVIIEGRWTIRRGTILVVAHRHY